MDTFSGTANEVYQPMVDAVMSHGDEVNPRGTHTLELHPVMIELERPSRRLVTSYGRPINVTFALAEVLWILGGRNDVEMLSGYNSTIGQFSDDGEIFNAPYGYRMRTEHGFDQLADAIRSLKADRDSRQVTILYWKPSKDLPFVLGDPNPTNDRACNVLSHLMIRKGALDWLQIVRSNDLIWGTPYNWMQFTNLQDFIASALGIEVGNFYHVADSLHIYDYHFNDAQAIKNFDIYEYLPPHPRMEPWDLTKILTMEELARSSELQGLQSRAFDKMPLCWQSYLWHFIAQAYYKEHNDRMAYRSLCQSPDKVYAAAQVRFYWTMRWRKKDMPSSNRLMHSIEQDFPTEVAHWICAEPQEPSNG